jgi:hypothetical protein
VDDRNHELELVGSLVDDALDEPVPVELEVRPRAVARPPPRRPLRRDQVAAPLDAQDLRDLKLKLV